MGRSSRVVSALASLVSVCALGSCSLLSPSNGDTGTSSGFGTLNIIDTWNVEQKSDMYIMVYSGAAVVAQGYNQVVQDVVPGGYVAKFYGRANDGKIYTDDSWNLCFSSNIVVEAGKVNQYKTNSGCTGKHVPGTPNSRTR